MLGYTSFQESVYRAASVGNVASLRSLALSAEEEKKDREILITRLLLQSGGAKLSAEEMAKELNGRFKCVLRNDGSVDFFPVD